MGKKAVTLQNPCPICGKDDWCLIIDGQNGPLYYCKRVREDSVTSGGEIYRLVGTTAECGKYEAESQIKAAREAYIAKLKAENPNYKPSSKKTYKKPSKPAPVVNSNYINRDDYEHCYNLPTEDGRVLDKVYRTFLDCLILEDNHKKVLMDDWGEDIFNKITSRYPIRSMPMPDAARFAYGQFFASPWRKKIIEQMVEKGVTDEEFACTPMFYQVGSGEDEKWTFIGLAGMVFPVYNPAGQIIRLRVRDDYPAAKGVFNEEEGNFYFNKDGWYFKGQAEPILVYQPKGKIYKVKLDKNGVPLSDNDKKSKVRGKYKNLSSFKEVDDDENKKILNKYKNGSQSGSHPSIYFKEGDSFTVVFFTEGEKKAMVANEILGAPCVCFPGVGMFRTAFEKDCYEQSIIDFCLSKGMRQGVLCYDADKNSNAAVLTQEKECLKWFIEHNIELLIGEWTEAFGKGLDDVLLNGVRPTLHKVS